MYGTNWDKVIYGDDGYPAEVERGIRCGACPQRHPNVDTVKACHAFRDEFAAQQEAELAAERAIERHFEDRGYWEAIAERDWEDRNGVIQFDVAFAAAMAAA